jgi:hypothetical protein
MPSVPIEKILTDNKGAEGLSTIGYSLSGTNYKPVRGVGRYIGRTTSVYNESEKFDVVGIPNVDKSDIDTCYFGGSGSSAVLATGMITGPLAQGNNVRYPEQSTSYYNANNQQPIMDRIKDRLKYEEKLKIDLRQFNTLCLYAVADPRTVEDLRDGFTNMMKVWNPADNYPSMK